MCLVAMGATIGDGNTPVYRFEWDDGSSRRTDEDVASEGRNNTSVETLAAVGREDPDCDVTLVGFE